ncbi:MAG TPA: SRPBCC family protein [Candidatus Limnocylindrales bacterium]|nr:SRPBCC family protein [Candidatus Limnocylindrales bacterium]
MAIAETRSIDIARPVDVVFAALVDVEAWPEWLIASGVIGVERVAGADGLVARFTQGVPLRIEQRLAGVRSAVIDARVTALEPSTRFAVSGRDSDGIVVDIDATLEDATAEAAGSASGCRLEWSLRIALPLRLRLFESMAAPQVRRALALDLEAFRIRLESAPTD